MAKRECGGDQTCLNLGCSATVAAILRGRELPPRRVAERGNDFPGGRRGTDAEDALLRPVDMRDFASGAVKGWPSESLVDDWNSTPTKDRKPTSITWFWTISNYCKAIAKDAEQTANKVQRCLQQGVGQATWKAQSSRWRARNVGEDT